MDTEPTASPSSPQPEVAGTGPTASPDSAAGRAPSTEELSRLEAELAALEAELAVLEAADGSDH